MRGVSVSEFQMRGISVSELQMRGYVFQTSSEGD